MKPTPPTMKDSKIENEIVAGASNLKEDMSIHKPTPPLRRKDSQEETEMVSTTPKSQPEEVLPTPPTRQKKDQIEADRVPLMPEEPQVISTPTTSDKKVHGMKRFLCVQDWNWKQMLKQYLNRKIKMRLIQSHWLVRSSKRRGRTLLWSQNP